MMIPKVFQLLSIRDSGVSVGPSVQKILQVKEAFLGTKLNTYKLQPQLASKWPAQAKKGWT
jgi:hypothetical protein